MKEQIKMILFVVILGIVAAAILLGTEGFTSDRILDNQEYAKKSTILKAFDIDYEQSTVIEIYDEAIKPSDEEADIDEDTLYYTEDGTVGFEFEGKGLWGPIEGFMTLEADLVTIKGIQIIYNEETPGLGGVVAEQWYLDKFAGKKFDPAIIIKKDADVASTTEVDAITGATMTSTAFELLLNESYQTQKEVLSR